MSLYELVIDEEKLDMELLEKTIKFHIGISKKTGKVIFLRPTDNNTIREKVLLYLLGRKASHLIQYWNNKEGATPSEIAEDINVPGDSLRPYLMKLLNEELVKKSDGLYYVPNYKLQNIHDLLKPEDNIPF